MMHRCKDCGQVRMTLTVEKMLDGDLLHCDQCKEWTPHEPLGLNADRNESAQDGAEAMTPELLSAVLDEYKETFQEDFEPTSPIKERR